MATEVIMPQLGESVVEGTVSKWLKKEGEPIQEFEPLLEINTDKVDTEVPAPAGGIVLRVLVPEGATVKAGTPLAVIGAADEAQGLPLRAVVGAQESERAQDVHAPPPPFEQSPAPSTKPVAPSASLGVPKAGRSVDLGFISPVVAKLAAEHAVDLAQVRGSGAGGRITKKDVLAFVETQGGGAPSSVGAATSAWEVPASGELFRPTEEVFGPKAKAVGPVPPTSTLRPGTTVLLDPVRKAIAEHMLRSKSVSPHVTTVMEVDLGRVAAHRAAHKEVFARDGVNLTFSAYFAAASVEALKAMPLVNSSWSDQGILLHKAVHLGIAVSLGDRGLIVPVIKNAEQLSLLALARGLNDLADRARGKKLKPDDVQGGTFTITNHGVSGSLFATPIINQPQCAILGVGVMQKRVVVVETPDGDAFAIRPMAYISLTFDHRILDGAVADEFLGRVVQRLRGWT
jgi:2-oxoglutarate dehydrogenase E2 component (dihydrolipoamide succinyltransferase)